MPVPPLNIERQALGNATLEHFSELSLKQLKDMFRLKDTRTAPPRLASPLALPPCLSLSDAFSCAAKAVTLVINGDKWTKTKYTASIPGTPFPIDCEQFWRQKHAPLSLCPSVPLPLFYRPSSLCPRVFP
jgi:hypothetical protein